MQKSKKTGCDGKCDSSCDKECDKQKRKKTKKEEIPPAPPKEEKNKKIKITHTNAQACEKKPKIVAKFAEK